MIYLAVGIYLAIGIFVAPTTIKYLNMNAFRYLCGQKEGSGKEIFFIFVGYIFWGYYLIILYIKFLDPKYVIK